MKISPLRLHVSRAITSFTLVVAIGLAAIVSLSVYYQVGKSIERLHSDSRTVAISELQYSLNTFTETRLTVLKDHAQLPLLSQAVMQPTSMKANLTDFMSNLRILGMQRQLILLDYRGRTIHATLDKPVSRFENLSWIMELMAGELDHYVAVSKMGDEYVWQLAVPVLYNNYPEGVLITEFPADDLHYFPDVNEDTSDHGVQLLFEDEIFLHHGPQTERHSIEIPLDLPGFSMRILWDDTKLNAVRNPLLLKVTCGIIIGILITLAFALLSANRFFVRPLEYLKARATIYSNSPDLIFIPTDQVIEEISSLSSEFNAMLQKVHERELELVRAKNSLENKVRDRTVELQQSRNKLRELNENLELQVIKRTEELKEAHSRLVIQEKMASVGQLAAGIAHELNNPINFVRTNFTTLTENFDDLLELLEEYRDLSAVLDKSLATRNLVSPVLQKEQQVNVDFLLKDIPVLFKESQYGYERIAKIIQSMLDFSRTDQPGEKSWADINKGIEDTLIIAKNEYKYCAEVITELGNIDEILCSPHEIHQVFLNTIVNASHAISSLQRAKKGTIVIRTWQDNDCVYCEIVDDGPGIPEQNRSRIFDPFFTTKPPGKGTGLGLSISYDIIVRKHRGTIELNCPVSGGTIFTISLPRE